MNNLATNTPRASEIIMPLVRLLASDDLSWSDRCEIASAIRNTLRIAEGMKAEREKSSESAEQSIWRMQALQQEFAKRAKP